LSLHYIDRLSGSGENDLARNALFMLTPLWGYWPPSMAAGANLKDSSWHA
jgi:hypothetical protein